MKVLVTGANGFVGAALCRHLSSQGLDVLPAVRRPGGLSDERVLPWDDAAGWSAALASCESVIHLAGRAHVTRDDAPDPLQAFRLANVEPTLELTRRAAAAGVRRFVFVSTVKVHGEHTAPGASWNALDQPHPADAYAVSKWKRSKACAVSPNLQACSGWWYAPLVYGPGVKGNFAQLLRWVAKGLPLPLGAVNNQRSMVALDNLVSLLDLCAQVERSPRAAGQVLLVSDGQAVSTPQLLRKIAKAHARPLRLLPVPPALLLLAARGLGQGPAIDRLLSSLLIDDQATVEQLDWRRPVSMDEQLQRMARAEGF